MCLARNFADNPSQLEIGYTISKKYWGNGIATEVSKALVHYCFANTNVKDVVAVTNINNIGSQKSIGKSWISAIE